MNSRKKGNWSPEQAAAAFALVCLRSFRYAGAALSAAAHRWLDLARRYGGVSEREAKLFGAMYTCSDAFGGLPLAVLFQHFALLEPWLEQVILEPDELRPEIFFTSLAYYAAMAPECRAAETERKRAAREKDAQDGARKSGAKGRRGRTRPGRRADPADDHAEKDTTSDAGTEGYYRAESATGHAACQADLDRVAGLVADALDYRCCAAAGWTGAAEGGGLQIRCGRCRRAPGPVLTPARLRQTAGIGEAA